MKRNIKPRWTRSDAAGHEHKTRFGAWLCGRLQKLRKSKATSTPEEGRVIIESAVRQTLESGLEGFVIADLTDGAKNQSCMSINSKTFGAQLSVALQTLLENPQAKAATQYAIITALEATGSVQRVQVVGDDDCPCQICSARRMKEERHTTTKPH